MAESHALLLTRRNRAVALDFLDAVDESGTIIVRVSSADERRARDILHRFADKHFSFTDATSFAVMERLRMTAAFTFDRNFAQFGFVVLPGPLP